MEIIAKRIRALREGIGISQTKLAADLEATQSSINRYENNQTAVPAELLLRYADYFDGHWTISSAERISRRAGSTNSNQRPRLRKGNCGNSSKCALTRNPR